MSLFAEHIVNLATYFTQLHRQSPVNVELAMCRLYTPKRIMVSAYNMMIREKEIEPIENLSEEEKRKLWDEVKSLKGDKLSAIAIHTLKTLNNG